LLLYQTVKIKPIILPRPPSPVPLTFPSEYADSFHPLLLLCSLLCPLSNKNKMLTFSPSQWMEKGGKIQKSSSASFPPHNFINKPSQQKMMSLPHLLPDSPNPQKILLIHFNNPIHIGSKKTPAI
jgi:hypothetical protein